MRALLTASRETPSTERVSVGSHASSARAASTSACRAAYGVSRLPMVARVGRHSVRLREVTVLTPAERPLRLELDAPPQVHELPL
jgi:hypothetical protein